MKRVVVTGMGALTPLGQNVPDYWKNLCDGVSGAGPITRFDASAFRAQIACELKGYVPSDHFDRKEVRKMDLFTQYAVLSVKEALADSGLPLQDMDPYDTGVIWGTGQGGIDSYQKEIEDYVLNDYKPRFTPYWLPKLITNMGSGMVSLYFDLRGINFTTSAACATTNAALMDALNYIRMGKAKVMVAGGSEMPITPAAIGGFGALRALSQHNHDPAKASRPFDVDRDGFVAGEGGGALILEELDHALARGAHIYAELKGAAMTADAFHITAPRPDGEGAREAMRRALEDAQVLPEQVDYLNAHATSTPVGDMSELKAIHELFGVVPQMRISSTKSMTGHLLGGAGAIEAIACILAIRDGIVPPTINTENPDPEVPEGLQLVLGKAASHKVDVAISNGFGFGGHNSTVVFSRFVP